MLKRTLLLMLIIEISGCSSLPSTLNPLPNKNHTALGPTATASMLYQQGSEYDEGIKRPRDLKKARHFYELAISKGSIDALNALGVLEIASENYKNAQEYFEKAAKSGDEIAYFNLGNLAIVYNPQVPVNQRALQMYGKAADLKYAPALVALGDMYSTGKGVQVDFSKAENYYMRAADLESDEGVNRLALLYLLQDGLDSEDNTENAKKTLALIKKVAEKGNAQALYIMSMVYQNGYMVESDQDKAIDYLRQAAEKGFAEAEYSLGYLYLTGFGVQIDNQKGIDYLTRSANGGYSNAQNNLGMLFLKGEVTPKDEVKAKHYLGLAITQGNPMAAFNLSLAYTMNLLKGGTDDEIRSLAMTSAQQGYTPAMVEVAKHYANGNYGFKKDNEQARFWLDKAIEHEDSDAMVARANAYFFGAYGYVKDKAKAKEWLDKAKGFDNPSIDRVEHQWRSIERAERAQNSASGKLAK